jgi:hypothetical protein
MDERGVEYQVGLVVLIWEDCNSYRKLNYL